MSISGPTNAPSTGEIKETETTDQPKAPKGGSGAPPAKAPPIAGLKEELTDEEWQKELQMLAQNFCTSIKRSNDRLIKEMKKNRQD